jgi:Mn-dependent DtxR family transcriptional regulator
VISKRLHINYRTVTEDLNRLVEAGLASVSVSKGVRFYGCTTEGRRLLNNLDECAQLLREKREKRESEMRVDPNPNRK